MGDDERKFYFNLLKSLFGDIGEPMDDEEEPLLFYQERPEAKKHILH